MKRGYDTGGTLRSICNWNIETRPEQEQKPFKKGQKINKSQKPESIKEQTNKRSELNNRDNQQLTILSISNSGILNSIIKKVMTYPARIIITGEACQCPSEAARAVDQPPSELIAHLEDAWSAWTVAHQSGKDKPHEPIKIRHIKSTDGGFGGLLGLAHCLL